MPGVKRLLGIYQELKAPTKIMGPAAHVLLGTATGTVSVIVTDKNDNKHKVQIPGVIVLGFGRHLFSSKEAAKQEITTIIDREQPRLHLRDRSSLYNNCGKTMSYIPFAWT